MSGIISVPYTCQEEAAPDQITISLLSLILVWPCVEVTSGLQRTLPFEAAWEVWPEAVQEKLQEHLYLRRSLTSRACGPEN